MQPVVVDLHVAHSGVLADAAGVELGAMHPPRGFPEPLADLGGLALEQVHLVGGFVEHRGAQAGAVDRGIGHAPVPLPLPYICRVAVGLAAVDGDAGAAREQELGHVHADPASADHGHAAAGRARAGEQLRVGHDHRMIGARQVELAGADAGGDDDMVKIGEVGGLGTSSQVNGHVQHLEAASEILEGGGELLLAGHAHGVAELAAELGLGLEDLHRQPARRGRLGAGEPRRPGPHHGDPLTGGRHGEHEVGLAACARVDQAGRALIGKGVVEARLVARNTDVDFIGPALGDLRHEGGVGEQRPRHRHQICLAAGEDLLGRVGGVDAVGGDDRHTDLGLEAAREVGERGARHRGDDGGNAGLVPADSGVEHVDARRLQTLGEFGGLGPGLAAVNQVEKTDAVLDEEVGADLVPDATHDLLREPHAFAGGAAPGVVTVVGAGGEELVDEVALGAHDLDAVVARPLGQPGRASPVADGPLDALRAQPTGLEHADG